MPKEIISGSAVGTGGYHVKVGWTNDREVQVGVEADEGRSLFWMLLGVADPLTPPVLLQSDDREQRDRERQDRRLAEVGAYIRATVATATGVELAVERDDDPGNLRMDAALARGVLNNLDSLTHGMCSSVWSDLDRAGCNRLIQIVRRARDSAYGRDE